MAGVYFIAGLALALALGFGLLHAVGLVIVLLANVENFFRGD